MNGDELRRHYDSMISIWIHMDQSLWTSINIFLIIEGICFAATYTLAQASTWNELAFTAICLFGLVISIIWFVVGGRRKAALILIEHQARHLEKEIFSDKIAGGVVEEYFPMYFTAAKAVFLNHRKVGLGVKPHEKKIRNHHLNSLRGGKLGISSRFSSMTAMTFWIPLVFLIIWIITLVYTAL